MPGASDAIPGRADSRFGLSRLESAPSPDGNRQSPLGETPLSISGRIENQVPLPGPRFSQEERRTADQPSTRPSLSEISSRPLRSNGCDQADLLAPDPLSEPPGPAQEATRLAPPIFRKSRPQRQRNFGSQRAGVFGLQVSSETTVPTRRNNR